MSKPRSATFLGPAHNAQAAFSPAQSIDRRPRPPARGVDELRACARRTTKTAASTRATANPPARPLTPSTRRADNPLTEMRPRSTQQRSNQHRTGRQHQRKHRPAMAGLSCAIVKHRPMNTPLRGPLASTGRREGVRRRPTSHHITQYRSLVHRATPALPLLRPSLDPRRDPPILSDPHHRKHTRQLLPRPARFLSLGIQRVPHRRPHDQDSEAARSTRHESGFNY